MKNRNSSLTAPSIGNQLHSLVPGFLTSSSEDLFSALDQLAEELISPRYRPRLKEIYQTNSKFPALEVFRDEAKENLILKLYASGYDKNKITVEYDSKSQAVVVSGDVESNDEKNNDQMFYSEVKKSSFQRRIPVSEARIKDFDKIKSSMENGVLEIRIPYEFEDREKPPDRKRIAIE